VKRQIWTRGKKWHCTSVDSTLYHHPCPQRGEVGPKRRG